MIERDNSGSKPAEKLIVAWVRDNARSDNISLANEYREYYYSYIVYFFTFIQLQAHITLSAIVQVRSLQQCFCKLFVGRHCEMRYLMMNCKLCQLDREPFLIIPTWPFSTNIHLGHIQSCRRPRVRVCYILCAILPECVCCISNVRDDAGSVADANGGAIIIT